MGTSEDCCFLCRCSLTMEDSLLMIMTILSAPLWVKICISLSIMGVPFSRTRGLGSATPSLLQNTTDAEKAQIARIEPLFKALAKVESITFLTDAEQPPLSSSSVVGHVSVFVPMKGLIDPKAELGRLQKDLDKVQKQHDQIATKLGNEGFVAKAPAAVVEGETVKLAEFADQLAKIKANMEQIAAL